MELEVRVIEYDDFEPLREFWPSLLGASSAKDNIFLTWEWLSTWWKHNGHGKRLLILLVEDEGRSIAAAPLMLTKQKVGGFGLTRRIEFVGKPDSDYHNILMVNKETECVRLILEHLVEHYGFDWISLSELPDPTVGHLRGLMPRLLGKLNATERVCEICPFLTLPKTFDQLTCGYDRGWLRELNRRFRKMAKEHRVEMKRYDEIGFTVDEAMDALARLHQARWIAKGMKGHFKDASFYRFHSDLAASFARKGWLAFYFLTADGEPVSAEYGFEMGNKLYAYLSGTDPEYRRYAVGKLHTMQVIDDCIKRGFAEYDFLRGDEPYKFQFTSSYRTNYEVVLTNRGVKNLLYDCDRAVNMAKVRLRGLLGIMNI